MGTLTLRSPAFDDGAAIPREYGYTDQNVNPPLTIVGVPDDAESLALIVDDPDARGPAGKIWDHWIVWDVDPDTTDIPANWSGSDAREGQNDYGERGYGGPNPPDGEHTYRFTLYALDVTVGEGPQTAADLRDAMEGHILARTRLTGTFAP